MIREAIIFGLLLVLLTICVIVGYFWFKAMFVASMVSIFLACVWAYFDDIELKSATRSIFMARYQCHRCKSLREQTAIEDDLKYQGHSLCVTCDDEVKAGRI